MFRSAARHERALCKLEIAEGEATRAVRCRRPKEGTPDAQAGDEETDAETAPLS